MFHLLSTEKSQKYYRLRKHKRGKRNSLHKGSRLNRLQTALQRGARVVAMQENDEFFASQKGDEIREKKWRTDDQISAVVTVIKEKEQCEAGDQPLNIDVLGLRLCVTATAHLHTYTCSVHLDVRWMNRQIDRQTGRQTDSIYNNAHSLPPTWGRFLRVSRSCRVHT